MPTKIFLNFYFMATGLFPKHHGMISNSPCVHGLAKTFNARFDLQNPEWWAGEPIWISAEKQGIKTATYFGGSSEFTIDGGQPSYGKPYQQKQMVIYNV